MSIDEDDRERKRRRLEEDARLAIETQIRGVCDSQPLGLRYIFTHHLRTS